MATFGCHAFNGESEAEKTYSQTEEHCECNMNFYLRLIIPCLLILPIQASADFIELPEHGGENSAYMLCSTSGKFGLETSEIPNTTSESCHVIARRRKADESPIPGFQFKELAVREVFLPEQYGDPKQQAAQLFDYLFRNDAGTECIYTTLIRLNNIKLKNGENWEINDITRGGFAGRPVSAAYFFSYHPKGIRSTENVFRIGRTHTAVPHHDGDADLPGIANAPAPKTPISTNQKAAVSSNWVTFTTDLNAHDPDGTSFFDSSVMYIKTTCNADNPVEYPDAIRLKTTGQNGQTPMEIRLPGFAPTGATIELY